MVKKEVGEMVRTYIYSWLDKRGKKDLLEMTSTGVTELERRVSAAALQSSADSNLYESGLEQIVGSISLAYCYFRAAQNIVAHPEVGKTYPFFRPFKRARAREDTKRAAYVLNNLPDAGLKEVYLRTRSALQDDVENGVLLFARGLKNGITDDQCSEADRVSLRAVLRCIEIGDITDTMREEFDAISYFLETYK